MDDRKLLELAAMAAGVDISAADWGGSLDGFYWVKDGLVEYWNPLNDDGDALRLAVKLEFEVNTALMTHWGMCSYVTGPHWTMRRLSGFGTGTHGDDAYAATRRVIVRAAAAIAEQQQHQGGV